MDMLTPQPELSEQERMDRLNDFVASDAFLDYTLNLFAEGVRRAVAEQIAKGVIDPV